MNHFVESTLKASPLFADLPDSVASALYAAAQYAELEPGALLFSQGTEGQALYVLGQGQARLVQHTPDGRDVTLSMFGPGDMIGLVVALDSMPYPGSLEAITRCELVRIPGATLQALMLAHAPLAVRALKLVSARLHEAHDRIRELSAERAAQRIARALVRLAGRAGLKQADGSILLNLRLSRQEIAQLTGTTLETVSRVMSGWEREGLVESAREQVTIRQPHNLVLIAEDLPR